MSGASVQIKVNNFPAVRKALKGSDLMGIAMGGARIVQSQARIYCPVDTGNLRASIMASPGEQSDLSATAEIGTDVIYAAIQELGGAHIKAQPYLRPAMDNHKRQIGDAIGAMVKATLQRVTTA